MSLRPILYLAQWVLPVTAEPIADGGVLVDGDGRIAAVGPRTDLQVPDGAGTVELGDAALLPGLVNTHAHPELAAFRNFLEDLPFHEWIPTLHRTRMAAALEDAAFEASARWTCVESLAAGITCIGATEDSGAAQDAMREAGMRGVVYREVFGPDPEQADAAMVELRLRVAAMRTVETDLVRVGISPHAPYTVSDELYRRAAEYARSEGLPVACHAAEAEVEQHLVREGGGAFAEGLRRRGIDVRPRGRSTVDVLERTGILDLAPLLIHCVHVDRQDIAAIAAAGASVAHCPVANARLGHGTAPLPEMLAAGVTVGLGSDSVASNNRTDLLEEARIAQVLHRARCLSPTLLSPDRLLRLSTIEGARALGLDQRIGSLEVGKDADLCAVSFISPHTAPVNDPVANLFHAARGSDVVLAMVRGRILYRDRTWLTLEPRSLEPVIRDCAARLQQARVTI